MTGKKKEDKIRNEYMLQELRWLSINQLCAQARLLETWKAINVTNHPMKDIMEVTYPKSNMTTRSAGIKINTAAPFYKSHASFKYPSAKLWNISPTNIKNARTLNEARKNINAFVRTLPYDF